MDTLYRQGFNAGKKFAQLEAQADFIKVHEIAVKWVDRDHHDWQELMNLRWGDKYEVPEETD